MVPQLVRLKYKVQKELNTGSMRRNSATEYEMTGKAEETVARVGDFQIQELGNQLFLSTDDHHLT